MVLELILQISHVNRMIPWLGGGRGCIATVLKANENNVGIQRDLLLPTCSPELLHLDGEQQSAYKRLFGKYDEVYINIYIYIYWDT